MSADRVAGSGGRRAARRSFREFGTEAISSRIARMLSFARAVRRGTDPEAVHDMRVASRRLRAALAVFEPAFDSPEYGRLMRETRLITSALSRARDLDVMGQRLTKDAATLPASQRGLVTELIREWAVERRRVQDRVVDALDRLNKKDMSAWFTQIAAGVEASSPEAPPDGGDDPA